MSTDTDFTKKFNDVKNQVAEYKRDPKNSPQALLEELSRLIETSNQPGCSPEKRAQLLKMRDLVLRCMESALHALMGATLEEYGESLPVKTEAPSGTPTPQEVATKEPSSSPTVAATPTVPSVFASEEDMKKASAETPKIVAPTASYKEYKNVTDPENKNHGIYNGFMYGVYLIAHGISSSAKKDGLLGKVFKILHLDRLTSGFADNVDDAVEARPADAVTDKPVEQQPSREEAAVPKPPEKVNAPNLLDGISGEIDGNTYSFTTGTKSFIKINGDEYLGRYSLFDVQGDRVRLYVSAIESTPDGGFTIHWKNKSTWKLSRDQASKLMGDTVSGTPPPASTNFLGFETKPKGFPVTIQYSRVNTDGTESAESVTMELERLTK